MSFVQLFLLIQLISAVVNRNWTEVAKYGNLENWREILAALVTYAGPEDFAPLCGKFNPKLTIKLFSTDITFQISLVTGWRKKLMDNMAVMLAFVISVLEMWKSL